MNEETVEIYTDGACKGNPGVGGWGALLRMKGKERELFGGEAHNWKKRGWKTADRKPVKNEDLWRRLDALAEQHHVEWVWVKGHAGFDGNERADQLANKGVEAMLGENHA